MTVTDPAPSTSPGSVTAPEAPQGAPTDDAYLFVQANFGPVHEERTDTRLDVVGAIPPQLDGRYLRVGPNPIGPTGPAHHWFLGEGMVHGVRLGGGEAEWYRNRWVRSSAAQAALGEANPVPRDEGGIYEGMGNTNVVHHAGQVLAITEGALPFVIGEELDTVRATNFGGPMPIGMNAHPKFDPDTNEMHSVSYAWFEPCAYYQVVSTDGRIVRSVPIDSAGPSMMHDMAMTDTRIVLFDLPVVFRMALVEQGRQLPYIWDPDYTPRVGLLSRTAGEDAVTWVELGESCYVYHPLNAHDLPDGRVVIDLVVHPRAFDDPLRGDPSQGDPTLHRWTIDPVAGSVRDEVIDAHPQEFPRADERLAGRAHRYGYSIGYPSGFESIGSIGDLVVPILKHDVVAGTTTEKVLGRGQTPSELVFVPAAPDSGEDEGWLVGYVHDQATDTSDLVILDAHDWSAEPVARVKLPVRVPAGFHGNWIPDAAL